MMRYSQAEKMEIIRLIEGSELSIKQTLEELDVPRMIKQQRNYVPGVPFLSHMV